MGGKILQSVVSFNSNSVYKKMLKGDQKYEQYNVNPWKHLLGVLKEFIALVTILESNFGEGV